MKFLLRKPNQVACAVPQTTIMEDPILHQSLSASLRHNCTYVKKGLSVASIITIVTWSCWERNSRGAAPKVTNVTLDVTSCKQHYFIPVDCRIAIVQYVQYISVKKRGGRKRDSTMMSLRKEQKMALSYRDERGQMSLNPSFLSFIRIYIE